MKVVMKRQYTSPSIMVVEVESKAMLLNGSLDTMPTYRTVGDEGDFVKQEGGGTRASSERSLWDESW